MNDNRQGVGDESPWASDSIPVSEPVPIVWDAAAPRAGAPLGDDSPAPSDEPRRRWPFVALALVIGIAFVVAWRSIGGEAATGAVDPASSVPASTDIAPSTPTTPDTLASVLPDGVGADGGAGAGPMQIDLPDLVARIEAPTEIVMVTDDALVHTLSLPSGRVRTTTLPDEVASANDPGSRSVITSPTATLVTTFGRDLTIVPRIGDPISVDTTPVVRLESRSSSSLDALGWISHDDGSTGFLVEVYDDDGTPTEFLIDDDGGVTPIDAGARSTTPLGFGPPTIGRQIVNDAGGVYLIEGDAAPRRISTGTAFAASATSVLVRECDETLQCRFAIASIDDGTSHDVTLPLEAVQNPFNMSLSPDGAAISFFVYGTVIEQVVADLTSGAAVRFRSDGFDQRPAWAPDGSGQFALDQSNDGLRFLDRASGKAIAFASSLGRIVALDVRSPDTELQEPPAVSVGALTVTPALVGPTDLRLVTFSRADEMSLLDIDAGTVATWTARPLTGTQPRRLFATTDAVGAFTDAPQGGGFVSQFGAVTDTVERSLVPSGPLFPGPDGLIWSHDPDGDGVGIDEVLVQIDGNRPTNRNGQLSVADGRLLGGDSRGGLVFESGGDVFTSPGGTVERLTTGELVAIGANHALARECDGRLVCTVVRIDRATGERTGLVSDLGAAVAVDGERVESSIGTMSPDGNVALVLLADQRIDSEGPGVDRWFFVDLAAGTSIVAAPPDPAQAIVWNDDATYGAYVSDGAVVMYHSTGEMIAVTGPDGVRALVSVSPEFGAVPPGDRG